jgi:integrase
MSSVLPTPEDLAREYETKLHASARAHYTNDQLLGDYFEHMLPMLAPSSVETWRNRNAVFQRWLTARGLHVLSLTSKEAHDYKAWVTAGNGGKRRALCATSVHRNLSHASLVCKYLRDERGLTRVNPFASVTRAYFKQHKAEMRPDLRALTEEEAQAMLEAAECLDDFVLLLFLAKTGLRRDEAASVRMETIDWEARTVLLDAHSKRSFRTAYFDEELAHFLRLKVTRNQKAFPGNPFLWPSPRKGAHLSGLTINRRVKLLARKSRFARSVKDWKSGREKVTAHTTRRAFTSWLKRARSTAPQGCPSHVVATLRGDSIRARSELIPDPTQGIYTKFGQVDGKDELRYWYDKCMPMLGARAIWEEKMPATWNAKSVQALIRGVGSTAR